MEDNDRNLYAFDQTIFYPEGGGQSSDRGWINEAEVLDVKFEDGEVWHLLSDKIQDPVTMKLDWDMRYANMQQHTGQHIMSACFKNLHDLDTISVHLGSDITLIEIDASEINEKVLTNTESAANQIIRENHPVVSEWRNRSDLEGQDLRRKIKSQAEKIRLIKIDDIDSVGCGGVHVRLTAEVGLIKVVGVEKIRNHVRVRIKIGYSAYKYLGQLHYVLQKVSNDLTISIDDLPDRIAVLLNDNRELSRKANKTSELWLGEYAKNLVGTEESGYFIIEELSKENLKILSEKWLEIHQLPCAFISQQEDHTNFYLRIPIDYKMNIQDFIQQHRKEYAIKCGGGRDFAVGELLLGKPEKEIFQKFFNVFNVFIKGKE